MQACAEAIIGRVRELARRKGSPFLVAIDGGSGCGKSSIAALVAEQLGAVVISSDDFFSADIADAKWDSYSSETRAARCIQWSRLRAEALEPMLSGRPAVWRTFDFEAGPGADGTYALRSEAVERGPSPVVVMEGTNCSRPELGDLIDFSVLVDVPANERHRRLAERESAEFLASWHARWDEAEAHYFEKVRPKASFDLVVENGAG